MDIEQGISGEVFTADLAEVSLSSSCCTGSNIASESPAEKFKEVGLIIIFDCSLVASLKNI